MLAFLAITINAMVFMLVILASVAVGLLVGRLATNSKQKSAIARLEVEMLRSHSEILQLQKELSRRDEASSKTPIVSLHDSGTENTEEKIQGASRLSKKVAGGGTKSSS